MQNRVCPPLLLGLLLALSLGAGSGCGPASERLDRRDERDPLVIRGDARKRAGDVDGAIELYQRALDRNPNLALAHLKLAVEFDDHQADYLRAIYHYSRYLELRPNAEKRGMVEELIRMAHISYLAALPDPPRGAIERIAELERENEGLRHQVSELTAQLRQTRTAAADQRPASPPDAPATRERPRSSPASTPRTEPDQAAAQRTYRVQRGDNLSRIAREVYGDSTQWRRIYEANRDQLATPDSLREGQTLNIP